MLKKILAVLVLAIIGFCGYVATLPAEYRYERSLTIAAPVDAIFPHVNSQKGWEKWSPWAKLDPEMKVTYEGPDAGVGSVGHWEGNKEVGKGSSTIVESVTNERIKFAMEFLEPMKSSGTVEFVFVPADGGTNVSWSMSGTSGFFGKAIGVIMNCKKMCESMFDKGLANLAVLATADTAAKAAAAAADAAEAAKALEGEPAAEEAPAKE